MGAAMNTLPNGSLIQPNTSDRPPAGPLAQALTDALNKSLAADGKATLPISPAVLKPLNLLPRNMLLVSDGKSLQGPALDVLSRWDIDAEVAVSGADALKIAASGEFDIILIDAKKTVLDGVFVSSRMRQLEREQNRRPTAALVAQVGGHWPASEAVLRMAGVDDVLKAASDAAAVGECLRRWCSGCYRPPARWRDARPVP
jgi:two-component system sensor histidine kinase BarA